MPKCRIREKITTPAFVVGSGVPTVSLYLSGLTTNLTSMSYIFCQNPFSTINELGNTTVAVDTWQQVTPHDLSSWQGKTVKLRISPVLIKAIGVDDITIQGTTIPGWEASGTTAIVPEGNGNHYATTDGMLLSDPFIVDNSTQRIGFAINHISNAGVKVYLADHIKSRGPSGSR
ncbi:MAG: hypothetical protein R2867_01205 [Caldilineaceae bacterium]